MFKNAKSIIKNKGIAAKKIVVSSVFKLFSIAREPGQVPKND